MPVADARRRGAAPAAASAPPRPRRRCVRTPPAPGTGADAVPTQHPQLRVDHEGEHLGPADVDAEHHVARHRAAPPAARRRRGHDAAPPPQVRTDRGGTRRRSDSRSSRASRSRPRRRRGRRQPAARSAASTQGWRCASRTSATTGAAPDGSGSPSRTSRTRSRPSSTPPGAMPQGTCAHRRVGAGVEPHDRRPPRGRAAVPWTSTARSAAARRLREVGLGRRQRPRAAATQRCAAARPGTRPPRAARAARSPAATAASDGRDHLVGLVPGVRRAEAEQVAPGAQREHRGGRDRRVRRWPRPCRGRR